METLIEKLKLCEILLLAVHENFWANKIKSILSKSNDSYIVEAILSWYGGMGSFNDLIISEYNGHVIPLGQNEDELNLRLSSYRDVIYDLANMINRENT